MSVVRIEESEERGLVEFPGLLSCVSMKGGMAQEVMQVLGTQECVIQVRGGDRVLWIVQGRVTKAGILLL
jgi:hypothetical protein